MITAVEMINDLRQHEALCQNLFVLIQREVVALRAADSKALIDSFRTRKETLPRLQRSVEQLRTHRLKWQGMNSVERSQHPEVSVLLRRNQDLIMKIIVLDRENEQSLLRHGLIPGRQLPPANRQRPHFVADLYRNRGAV